MFALGVQSRQRGIRVFAINCAHATAALTTPRNQSRRHTGTGWRPWCFCVQLQPSVEYDSRSAGQPGAARQKEQRVQWGVIGLGRMGANTVRRFPKRGHRCVAFDHSVFGAPRNSNGMVPGAGHRQSESIDAETTALRNPERNQCNLKPPRYRGGVAARRAVSWIPARRYQPFSSRGEANYQDQLLSAMRYQFGGHLEKGAGKQAA